MRKSILIIGLVFIVSVLFSFWTFGIGMQESEKIENAKQAKSQVSSMMKETTSVTKHSITIQDAKIDYTATAGNMILRKENGKEKGSIFYIAYTQNGVKDPSRRPLMFCFNGGPGGAAVWVHLGAFGPKKSLLDDDGFPIVPPPGKLVHNEFCVLDLTDLVFVDPITTGYSRAVPGEDPKQFYGFEKDVESISDFIRLYVTRNKRWLSPKFLAGESYATTRVVGLISHLQSRYGMFFNGAVLISAILNWQNTDFSIGNDLPYIIYLPSYTAAAWYHGKLAQELSGDLRQTLDKVEQFALDEYARALILGTRLEAAQRDEIIKKLAYFTGLSPEYIERSNLRVVDRRFYKELLRDEGKTVGRLDARYTGRDRESAGESPDFDQSWSVAIGSYVSLINEYIRKELGYESDLPYNFLARVWPWELKPKGEGEGYLNVAEILRSAMHMNPHLKVLFASGYYDFATPYFDSDYTVAHLGLAEELRKNIKIAYYESGHMMYVRKKEHQKLKNDLATFINSALGK